MRRTILLLAGVLLAVAALGSDSPKQYDDKTELAGIEGTWRRIETELGGRKINLGGDVRTFRNGTYTINWSDSDMWQGTYHINQTFTPHHFDWIPSRGDYKGQTLKCIYQIDGDTLKIANKIVGEERPQGFNDDGLAVSIYKRVKK
jgi:uncharacterized protein (TIGR03067 family)